MTINDNTATHSRPMEPIKLDNLLISFTTEFQRVWDTKNLRSSPAGFWRPAPPPDVLPGYFSLGDLAIPEFSNITGTSVAAVVREADSPSIDSTKGKALSRPANFEQVWKDSGSGAKTYASIWRPIPPEGYVALGLVCASDHEKPSVNSVRCVRMDLVAPATVGTSIWSDKGSGAKQNFSAWSIEPPIAVAGEICFSPGTFTGVQSHSRPSPHLASYALRIPITLQSNTAPAAPILSGFGSSTPIEPATVTQVARLPWFAVRDDMHPLEQLRSSPYYRLERADRYVLVGHEHNAGDQYRSVKWTAERAQNASLLQVFNRLTAIEFDRAWPIRTPGDNWAIRFSANLATTFTHTETSPGGWRKFYPLEVVALAAKHSMVAVYQRQSEYRLLRADNTPVTFGIEYSDDESLYLSQYPSEKDAVITCPLPMASGHEQSEVSFGQDDIPALASKIVTVITDTAP
ncbi:Vps62-related protein [Pseudomonas fitomaticsae]